MKPVIRNARLPTPTTRAKDGVPQEQQPRTTPGEKSVDGDGSTVLTLRRSSPLKFFLLVFALSIPFWVVGAVTGLQLMPGLSVSALVAFCPVVAALILVRRENKTAGVPELLRRSFDFKRIRAKRWYAPILLLMPGVSVAVYLLLRWMDMPVPAPRFSILAALLMFLAFCRSRVAGFCPACNLGQPWHGTAPT